MRTLFNQRRRLINARTQGTPDNDARFDSFLPCLRPLLVRLLTRCGFYGNSPEARTTTPASGFVRFGISFADAHSPDFKCRSLILNSGRFSRYLPRLELSYHYHSIGNNVGSLDSALDVELEQVAESYKRFKINFIAQVPVLYVLWWPHFEQPSALKTCNP
jgi:hypothetical protein